MISSGVKGAFVFLLYQNKNFGSQGLITDYVSQNKSMIAVKTSATSSTTSKLTNEDRDTEEQSTRVLGTVCINRSSDKMGAPVTAM